MTRFLLLGGGVAAPVTAVTLAVVAGLTEPSYSQIQDHVSGLASVPATTRWVMTPAFLLVGAGAVAFGVGLARMTGRNRATAVTVLAGASTVLVGLFPRSCVEVVCADPAWHHRLHDLFSVPAYGALIAVPVIVATHAELRLSKRAALLTAGTTAALALVFVSDALASWNGLVQRALVLVPLAWLASTATRLAILDARPSGGARRGLDGRSIWLDPDRRCEHWPMETNDTLTAATTELLQELIRNECVNDGEVTSGEEIRNSDLLETYLEGAGLDVEHYDAAEGRRSVVARIEGSDPEAPSLCLMGHTDVVPVNPDGWTRDPFAGELIEGEVWGRGAIDMLGHTSSMAVAFRHLADTGFKPKGDLIYFGVADEEAGGVWGAGWMVENQREAIDCDYVLTESGGITSHTSDGTALTLNVAEKGVGWMRLRTRGTPSHGSQPYGTDNALVKAAEVIRRIDEYRPTPQMHDLWKIQVANLPYDDDTKTMMLDPGRLDEALARLPNQVKARQLHACSHTTFSPNVALGGQKTNIIPDRVDIEIDVRTLPGETPDDVDQHLRNALGDMYDRIEVEPIFEDMATASPIDTPLWDVVTGILRRARPEAVIQPSLIVGGTDARFFRQIGATAYGAGLFSPAVTYELFSDRFHGHDERVDVESLALNTQFWIEVARELLG